MDSFNSFKPPVDASNGEPILPPEPENSSILEHDDSPVPEPEEKLDADETISEKVGPTSDENGYGTDPRGYSRERGDLDAADYNKQVGQRVNDVYAAAEKAQEAEEKAAFPGWYDDEPSTPQAETDPTDPTPPEGSPVLPETSPDTDTIKALREVISAKKEADDRFYDILINMAAKPDTATTALDSQAVNTPPTVQDAPLEAATDTAGNTIADETSDTESEPKTLSSTEVRNDMPPVTPVSNDTPRTEKPTQQTFLGKNGVIYSSREDAINSFKD